MTASFRKVDYSLRPAKHAERRMICEIFRKLSPFQLVEEYVYVGFGSLWFSDFILFHRALGVQNMISIEKSGAKERIKANTPFRSVTIDFRASSAALPDLSWELRHFLWLDYDDTLDLDMLLDARTVASNARSGSVLAISVQCQQAPEISNADEYPEDLAPFNRFREIFGRERIPADASDADLIGWPYARLSRTIILNEIESALAARNSSANAADAMTFHPICELEYEDGAKMTTIIGVLVSGSDEAKFRECEFDKLEFLQADGGALRILIPILTMREIRHLEKQLPGELTDLAAIPPTEAQRYANLYRYLPNFAVLET